MIVKSESRHTLSMIQSNDDRSLLAAKTHDLPLDGVIGGLDAKSIREAQRFVDERLAIKRKVRDVMASAQDKQKQYANQIVRKNNEHFILGDNVLLSTNTHAKHAISVLHGGTTKLLPRFIGPITMVEKVGDLNCGLSLLAYTKAPP